MVKTEIEYSLKEEGGDFLTTVRTKVLPGFGASIEYDGRLWVVRRIRHLLTPSFHSSEKHDTRFIVYVMAVDD